MRAKSRRYEKPLSIKMVRYRHRSLGNPLFRQRVKPSARVYDRKRQPAGAGSIDWRSTT
jgi:hypothetical protein